MRTLTVVACKNRVGTRHDNGSSCQRSMKRRQEDLGERWDAHGGLGEAGGPRMCWARAKVSMTSIGAPQCRHTKVGRRARDRRSPCSAGGGAWLMQQLASGRDVVLAVGVGEQTVVADAMKARGQHVQQEAAHELLGRTVMVL
jgi:hypothetical protein